MRPSSKGAWQYKIAAPGRGGQNRSACCRSLYPRSTIMLVFGGGGGNRTRVHERPGGVSTSLAVAFSLAHRPRVGRVRVASPEESRARPVGTSLPRPSPSIDATTPATDPPGVTSRLVRQPARECYSRQLCCSGSLTRPPDLGLLLRPRIRPCRDHVAPMSTTEVVCKPSVPPAAAAQATRLEHRDRVAAAGGSRNAATAHRRERYAVAVPLVRRPDFRRAARADQCARALSASALAHASPTTSVNPLPFALRAGRGA